MLFTQVIQCCRLWNRLVFQHWSGKASWTRTVYSVYPASNFEPLCSEYPARNNPKPAEARGHVAVHNTQLPHYTSICSLAEGWQKLSPASVVIGTRCRLIHGLKHEAINQTKTVCRWGDGHSRVLAGPQQHPRLRWRRQLRGGLCRRCHTGHFERFHHGLSELPLTSNSRTQSPTKWFWKPANSPAMGWCLVKSLLLSSLCPVQEDSAGGQLLEGLELQRICGSDCLRKQKPPQWQKRTNEEETRSTALGMFLGFWATERRTDDPEGQKSEGRLHGNFSLFPQCWSLMVSRFSSPIICHVILTYHQSFSPTLFLFSVKKFKLISTLYLSYDCCMPDNVQGSLRMQSKSDMLPPFGTLVILEWHDPWNVWRKI